MSRIGEEVAKAAPAAYGSQSKPRGRKPKKGKNVEKSDDHESGDDRDDTGCPPGPSEHTMKIRKGKGRKNKRGSKNSTKKSTKKSTKSTKKSTKPTKKGKRKPAKTANPPGLEDHEHYEPSELGVHDLDNGSVGSGGPSSGSRDVPGDVPGSNSLGALPKAKAKGSKSKGKNKNKSSSKGEPVGPDPLEPARGVALPHLPPNMVYPPDWVKAGNVYSNAYRRAKAEGKSPEEIKEISKDCAARFRKWGAVDTDLLASFGLFKRRRTNHPGPEEDGRPEGHEGDGMDDVNGTDGISGDDAA